jgi:hypothetical protein
MNVRRFAIGLLLASLIVGTAAQVMQLKAVNLKREE